MDQDVEAILNASDSEEDENLNVQGVSLEDILREDDGGFGEGDEDELLGAPGSLSGVDNHPYHGDSALPDLDLDRWRTGDREDSDTPGGRPLGSRNEASVAGPHGDIPLSPPLFGGGDHHRDGAASMGLSDPFSGDSYSFEADSSPSGFPPRTAFLSRDELSEDSRLLQQILKESEEEIAASAAERANGYSGGGGGPSSRSRIVADRGSAGGGEYPGADFEDDPSLQSLDVDKIIESMELETFQDDDEAIGFSGIIAGVSGNGGGGVSLRRGSTPSWRTTVTTSRTSSASRRRSSTGEVDGATDTSRTGGIRGVGDSEASAPAASAAVARRASTDSGVGGGANFGLVAAKTSLGGRPADDEDRFATEPLRAGEGSVAGVSSSRWRSQSGRLVGSGETGGSSGGGDWSLTEALRKAESAELRLLRGGNRDVVSPLQVKRRMRAPTLTKVADQQSLGFPGVAGGVSGGVGVVRMENLDAASRQLARNAAYGKHGPGVCTATAAHSKFIAVGTSRGLILLFDHFQEIRHVLGSAAGGGSDGTPPDDSVTSLDMCVGSDTLVAGHASGRVLLWDYLRGVVLRAVTDIHSSAVVSVRCFVSRGGGSGGFGVGVGVGGAAGGGGVGVGGGGIGGGGGMGGGGGSCDPAVITADVEGVVNKLSFRRVMWTKWVVDTECLLDGAAGPIPALCVLPSWTEAVGGGGSGIRTGTSAAFFPGFHELGMMAMSSWKNTFIVGIYPEVKVIHKWPRPPLPPGTAAELPPPPCLSWGPPQPSAARPQAPPMSLLARGWGSSIQILAATLVKTPRGDFRGSSGAAFGVISASGMAAAAAAAGVGGSASESGFPSVRWPSLAVVKELSTSAPVVAVEWLRDQVMAYLDADMELCVLDTRAGVELEHASLSTLGIPTSPILPPPPSSQMSSSAGAKRNDAIKLVAGHSNKHPASGTHHNAFRACEGRLYLLGRQELRAVRVQGWSQRVDSLVQAGEWLEALAVALDHYEQKVLPAEHAASATASIAVAPYNEGDLGGAGGGRGGVTSEVGLGGERGLGGVGGGGLGGQRRPSPPRSESAEQINDLLAQYLRLAINNAPAPEPGLGSDSGRGVGVSGGVGGDKKRINLAQSHFQMLAGVCAEFCAVTGRLDVLFGQVFSAFRARGQQGVFLETLEPYVLTGKLKTLSPEVLKAFVDRCQSVGDMLTAERLLLRLEPRSFDLSTMLPLLRRHRLHSALLAVRAARGDYVISVEEILREVMSVADREHGTVPLSGSLEASPGEGKGAEPAATAAAVQEPLRPYPADPTFDELGYKVLLYLTRCFQGRVLGGVESMSTGQTTVARSSLLHLLVQPTLSPSGATPRGDDLALVLDKSSSHPSRPQQHQRRWRWRGALFPYLAILLYLDAAATIEVLSVAMDSPEAVFRESADEAAAGLINPGASSPPVPGGASSATLTAYSREASSSSSVLEASKARSAGGGERKPAAGRGGGVWGRRIGRGRGRAIGWTSSRLLEAGGRSSTRGVVVAGEPVEWGSAGSSAAAKSKDECPSRWSIIESLTSVLAPHLSERAERETHPPQPPPGGEASPDASNSQDIDSAPGGRGGGVSAAAFVRGPRGGEEPAVSSALYGDDSAGDGDADGGDGTTTTLSPPPPSCSGLRDRDGQEWWEAARPRLFGFVAKYLELSLVSVGPRLTNAVLVSVAKGEVGGVLPGGSDAKETQARLVTLLQRVPLSLVDRKALLPLAEKNGFFRAAVILLKSAVSLGEQRGFTLEQFARIVRCYLQDSEDGFRAQVFGFIRQEFARGTATKAEGSPYVPEVVTSTGGGGAEREDRGAGQAEAELLKKRGVVLLELPRLMELNKAEAVFTIGEAFRGDHKAALAALSATTTLQFEYLDALLRPGSHGMSLTASNAAEASSDARKGKVWGESRNRSASAVATPSSSSKPLPGLAAGLDDGDRALHVRLLIRFRPYEVYPFLSSSTGYSLDDTLALCQERGVADATAYLLERKGDVTGALALALRTLSSRLASLRTALQAASLRDVAAEMAFMASPGSPSKRPPPGGTAAAAAAETPSALKASSARGFGRCGGTAPRAGTAAWARWASKVALEGLQEGRETTRSLMVAIELCQRASPPTGAPSVGRARGGSKDDFDNDGELDLSASLWFQTLDKILSAKGASVGLGRLSGSLGVSGGPGVSSAVATAAAGELPQTAAVMEGVLDALLQRTLSNMAGYVPLPVIVKKVVSDHAASSLGEFRHVILAMLETYSYDTAIHRTAASLLFDSLRSVVRERHTLKGAGVRVTAVAGLELLSPSAARISGVAGPASQDREGTVPTASLDDVGRSGPEPALLPPYPRPEVLDAVGSGVISVSTGGIALVEHLGRRKFDDGFEGDGFSTPEGDTGNRGASSSLTAGTYVRAGGGGGGFSSYQDPSPASLWRLRAARRRRQARAEKMRSLVNWATGEDTPAWNSGVERSRSHGTRGAGRGSGGRPEPGRGVGRHASAADGKSARDPGGTSSGEVRGRRQSIPPPAAEENIADQGGGEALGWGIKLQARALAIPASFLSKRT